jgi:hypothetical protein
VPTAKDLGENPDFYKISMIAPLPYPRGSPPLAAISREIVVVTNASDRSNPTLPRTDSSSSMSSIGDAQPAAKRQRPSASSDKPSHLRSDSPLTPTPDIEKSPSFDHLIFERDTEIGGGGAGHSHGSWNPESDDSLWGHNRYDGGYRTSGQVTPPSSTPPTGVHTSSMEGKFMPGNFGHTISMHPGQGELDMGLHETFNAQDTVGLTLADLCYLTQQNNILLEQAQHQQPEMCTPYGP